MKKKTKPSGRKQGRLSAEETAELPDRLMDAALEEFTAHGFGQTTMEKIARRAGASTKTLYSRFPNKVELLHAVVQRMINRTLDAHSAATSVDPRLVKPEVFLTSLGRLMNMGISGPGIGLIQLAYSEARHVRQLADSYNATLTRGRGIFRSALECWQDQGLLPNLRNPDLAASLCISILSDTGRIRAALGRPMTPEEIEAHVPLAVEIFLRGCGYTFGEKVRAVTKR